MWSRTSAGRIWRGGSADAELFAAGLVSSAGRALATGTLAWGAGASGRVYARGESLVAVLAASILLDVLGFAIELWLGSAHKTATNPASARMPKRTIRMESSANRPRDRRWMIGGRADLSYQLTL
jgi:hypothetical protein